MTAPLDPAEREQQLADQLQVLSETLRSFAESAPNYDQLLNVVAHKLAEVVKDGCVVRILTADGWLEPVAIHMPIDQSVQDPRPSRNCANTCSRHAT